MELIRQTRPQQDWFPSETQWTTGETSTLGFYFVVATAGKDLECVGDSSKYPVDHFHADFEHQWQRITSGDLFSPT